MSVFDVISEVMTALVAIPLSTFGRAITTELGPEFLARFSDPPRVVFVPQPDKTLPPSYVRPVDNAGSENQHPYKMTVESCQVYCWGELVGTRSATPGQDYVQTYELQRLVRLMLFRCAPGPIDFGPGRWVQPANVAFRGRCYMLQWSVQVPQILQEIPTLASPVWSPTAPTWPTAPVDLVYDVTGEINPDGTPEIAWQGTVTPV